MRFILGETDEDGYEIIDSTNSYLIGMIYNITTAELIIDLLNTWDAKRNAK